LLTFDPESNENLSKYLRTYLRRFIFGDTFVQALKPKLSRGPHK